MKSPIKFTCDKNHRKLELFSNWIIQNSEKDLDLNGEELVLCVSIWRRTSALSYLNFTNHGTYYYKTLWSLRNFMYLLICIFISEDMQIFWGIQLLPSHLGKGGSPSKIHLVHKILKIQQSYPLPPPWSPQL